LIWYFFSHRCRLSRVARRLPLSLTESKALVCGAKAPFHRSDRASLRDAPSCASGPGDNRRATFICPSGTKNHPKKPLPSAIQVRESKFLHSGAKGGSGKRSWAIFDLVEDFGFGRPSETHDLIEVFDTGIRTESLNDQSAAGTT
jgi:hypothetical protein